MIMRTYSYFNFMKLLIPIALCGTRLSKTLVRLLIKSFSQNQYISLFSLLQED